MSANEYTTDVPEHSNMKPKLYWDRRARGLGATPSNPVVSCAEENLLGYERDPYPSENIMVHEFAHAIHGTGLNRVDPTFDKRLRASYEAAKERGLWKNTYAETNRAEYWAEGVQCWFDDNAPPDSLHNDIRTRAALKKYDTNLAKLCEEVFGDREWRYERPSKRKPADLTHLTDYDPKKLPKFRWREAPITDRPKVTIQTSSGDFDVELDAKAAPAATAQFLKVALDGGYHSSHFERTVHDKLHEKDPATGRLVAAINPVWAKKWADDLKLNDLSKSTIAPTDGTLAMMRGGANRGSFILFVGTPNADPLDMVPFGRVTKGMDVIRKMLTGSVDIRRIIRSE